MQDAYHTVLPNAASINTKRDLPGCLKIKSGTSFMGFAISRGKFSIVLLKNLNSAGRTASTVDMLRPM